LEVPGQGSKYTATHDYNRFPAALLYGLWSTILGQSLVGEKALDPAERLSTLRSFKAGDGSYIPKQLLDLRNTKSLEYLRLHCTNYAMGAELALDPNADHHCAYLEPFLDGDFLARWLEGRSLLRPWEEGNNIVNVASYLVLSYERGVPRASDRIEQMLEWHRRYQSPQTGGFDAFETPSLRKRIESLAGAVHNFHLHLFLGERFGYEEQIAETATAALRFGRLSACLSLDFTQLAVYTLPFSANPQELVDSLLLHTEVLLGSQRADGGWTEHDDDATPSHAAGFRDSIASSCSYATWFRMASLGMIAIVLLGDAAENWHFRKTLGMGYAPGWWPTVPQGIILRRPPLRLVLQSWGRRVTRRFLNKCMRIGARL
jgi:hypothetical protein